MPYVKWRKGYQDLFPDEEPLLGKNTLNLTGILESANYTCVAQSDLGNIEAYVQVKVTGTSMRLSFSRKNKILLVLPNCSKCLFCDCGVL